MTYVLRDASWSFSHNLIGTTHAAQLLVNNSVDSTVWPGFVSTLRSDQNIWLASPTVRPFVAAGGSRYSFDG